MKTPKMTPEEAKDLIDTLTYHSFLEQPCPVCHKPFSSHSSADVAECEPKLQDAINNEE